MRTFAIALENLLSIFAKPHEFRLSENTMVQRSIHLSARNTTMTSLRVMLAIAIVVCTTASAGAAAFDLIWSDRKTDQILRAPVDGSGPIEVVLEGTTGTGALDVSDDVLYWSNLNGITSRPLAGGAITTLFSPYIALDIQVVGDNVYWSNQDRPRDTILRGSTDGGGSPTELIEEGIHGGMFVNESTIFWTNNSAQQIRKVAVDGSGLPVTLYDKGDYPGNPSITSPQDIWNAGDNIYWTDVRTDQILMGSADGSGPVKELYSKADYPGSPSYVNPDHLIILDGTIIWTDSFTDQILSAPLDGNGPLSVLYDIGDYPGAPSNIIPVHLTYVANVPEPSSLALLGIVSVGLIARRRKRRP